SSHMQLSEDALNLEFALTDTRRLIPVNLGANDLTAFQMHVGDAFALLPAPSTIILPQPRNFPNPRSAGDRLYVDHGTQDLKVHGRMLSNRRGHGQRTQLALIIQK